MSHNQTAIPNITINVNGCTSCGQPVSSCNCKRGQSADHLLPVPAARTPCNNEGCEDPSYFSCTLYDGEDIADFNIKKGDSLTKVINTLLQQIRNLQA